MPSALVDTAAWVALLNTRDELHEPARKQMEKLELEKFKLVTTEFVLLELANTFSAVEWRSKVVKFVEGLRRLANLQITPAEPPLFTKAWQLFRERPDKEWSLTDCASICVMQSEQIRIAFTSDHHFEQARFAKLL